MNRYASTVVALLPTRYIARMLIQVHGREKPAIPRRALLSAIALLVGTTALAATLTWRRNIDPLKSPIEPPGWSISFSPPERFHGWKPGLSELGPYVAFRVSSSSGVGADLVVHHLTRPSAKTARSICVGLIRKYRSTAPHERSMLPLIWLDRKLGPHGAVEIWDPQAGIVARAMLLQSGEAYAVYLVARGRIDPELYQLFESTCASIERR